MGSRYEWETDEVDTDIDYDLRCYFVGERRIIQKPCSW